MIRRRYNRIIIVVIVLGFLFLPRLVTHTPRFVWSTVAVVGRPLAHIRFIGDSLIHFFETKKQLVSENAKLKSENATLRLRLLNGTEDTRSANAIPILFSPQSLFHDRILIDVRGRVVSENEHITIEGIRVGTVEKVSGNSALVRLVWAYGNSLGARIDRISFNVTLEGSGAHLMLFTAPRDIDINAGDAVKEVDAPYRLIGFVDTISVSAENAIQTVYVRSPVNIHAVSFVDITE